MKLGGGGRISRQYSRHTYKKHAYTHIYVHPTNRNVHHINKLHAYMYAQDENVCVYVCACMWRRACVDVTVCDVAVWVGGRVGRCVCVCTGMQARQTYKKVRNVTQTRAHARTHTHTHTHTSGQRWSMSDLEQVRSLCLFNSTDCLFSSLRSHTLVARGLMHIAHRQSVEFKRQSVELTLRY